MTRPITILRLTDSGKFIAALLWLQANDKIGEVSIVFNKYPSKNTKDIVKSFVKRFLELTIGLQYLSLKDPFDHTSMSALAYVAYSPFQPYSYILSTLPSVSEGEEEHASYVLTTFHRLVKMPLSIIPEELIDANAPTIDVSRFKNDKQKLDKVITAAALAFAAATAGKSRSGYMLSLSLTQSLLAYTLLSNIDADETIKLVSTITSFICKFYQYRMSRESSELIRHMLAATPPRLQPDWNAVLSLLEKYTQLFVCRIRDNLCEMLIEALGEYTDKSDNLKKECTNKIFGRQFWIGKELRSNADADTVITIATEQWSLLQLLTICSATKAKNIILLYTPEVAHTVLTTHQIIKYIGGKETGGKDKIKVHICGRNVTLKYVLVSATDMFLTEKTIEKLLKRILKSDRQRAKENTIIVAQGPLTIALTLYNLAKKEGFSRIHLL